MGNTFTSLHFHIIYSTRNREPWISPDIEQRVWEFLGGIARENGFKALQIGGMPDHVHMVATMRPTLAVSDALQRLKGASSRWISNEFPRLHDFGWQDGYGAFTVSRSNLPAVISYIRNQREHHRTKTFREEYLAFLRRHEIEYNEKYVFD